MSTMIGSEPQTQSRNRRQASGQKSCSSDRLPERPRETLASFRQDCTARPRDNLVVYFAVVRHEAFRGMKINRHVGYRENQQPQQYCVTSTWVALSIDRLAWNSEAVNLLRSLTVRPVGRSLLAVQWRRDGQECPSYKKLTAS